MTLYDPVVAVPNMKVIIAGSRSLFNRPYLIGRAVCESGFCDIVEVVSGAAPGIDALGEEWARLNDKPVRAFPADWTKYGLSAGPIRNNQMAQYADALIAIWDRKSRGTEHMINSMLKLRKPVFVLHVGNAGANDD